VVAAQSNVASPLVAGVDYPRSHAELVSMFPDDEACARYLGGLRWPSGFVCEACGAIDEPWRTKRGVMCRHCRAQQRLLARTVLDATKTPLTTWVTAAWLVTTGKNGMSAKTLERTLGVSYHTAWAILQRFRVAMVRSERSKLSGDVEVDETLVGGVSRGGKSGRGSATKTVVVVAVEILDPKGFGRCRLRVSPSAEQHDLTPIVCNLIEPDSVLLTDAWRGYDLVEQHGYTRIATNLTQSRQAAHVVHPGVHRVASLLKRWLLGTHQGSVDPDHLQAYCEEFTFRFNRRRSTHRGLVFRRLLEQAMVTGPVRYHELNFGYWPTATATPRRVPAGTIRTLVVADRTSSRLARYIDNDTRFTRIGRATTADEARLQAEGLGAQLVVIDGDRDDDTLLDVVTRARPSGRSRVITVHVGRRTTATREQLTKAGADLAVIKAGRQNLLDSCAKIVDPSLPF
jgi:transposase-like protein